MMREVQSVVAHTPHARRRAILARTEQAQYADDDEVQGDDEIQQTGDDQNENAGDKSNYWTYA
jgi:hypothetical protein